MTATTLASQGHPLAPATASQRRALASLSLAMLLSSLGTSIANVGLPTLAQALGASFQQVQWVVLSYLLAITTSIVAVGRLGDLMGRRRLLLAGIALFTGASVLCGMAPTLWLLVAARALQGLGAAVMMALAMAMVGDTVGKERTGSAMGLLGTMSAIGTALGPSLGGLLLAGPGWRAMFLVNVPLGLLALLVAHRSLPAHRPPPAARPAAFDFAGMLLLAGTLAAYALAMTWGGGRWGPLNLALVAVAAAGMGLFVLVELKAASPLVRLQMLREPVLGTGLVTSALVATVMMTTLVVGPFYLSGALALGATAVGLVMTAGPLVAALTGVPAGRLVDRMGPRRVTLAGLGAMALGTLSLGALPPTLGVAGYILPLVVLTAGYGLFQAANNAGVMAGIRAEQRGLVSGMISLARNLGLVSGASLMGAVFACGAGTGDVAQAGAAALAGGMRTTFAVAMGMVLVALALVAWSRPTANGRPAQEGR
jgi:EmrB/QacA subfamily drug resistance transporter